MTCKDHITMIHEYLDQELDQNQTQGIVNHLEECPSCQREYLALQNLISDLCSLPREQIPARDLWPGIRRVIRKPSPVMATLRYGLATMVASLILVAGICFLYNPGANSTAVPLASHPDLLKALMDCEAARDLLTQTSIDCQTAPEIETILENNLLIIRTEQNTIRQAMEQYGDNPQLIVHLFQAYQNELNLLGETLQVKMNCTRRI